MRLEVVDSRKFYKNLFRAISSDSHVIREKYKKKFSAKLWLPDLTANCEFNISARLTGDGRDHMSFATGGKVNFSLKIKLNESNILNNTAFKLFIPETRNDLNEIFGTIVLRSLGIMAPETFQVNVDFGFHSQKMLFQEHINKEFIEKSHRREGPIFEADESLIWPSKKLNTLDREVLELEPLSFARLQNESWLKKGENHALIALNAHNKLQKVYLNFHQNWPDNRFLLFANNLQNQNMSWFKVNLIALNGSHGLANNNRKFYFNALSGIFEPIYYDGDLNLDKPLNISNEIQQLLKSIHVSTTTLDTLFDKEWEAKVRRSFIERVLLSDNQAHEIFDNYLTQYKNNLRYLLRETATNPKKINIINDKNFIGYLLETERKLAFSQDKYSINHKYGDYFVATKFNQQNDTWEKIILNLDKLSDLLSENTINGVRSINLPSEAGIIPKYHVSTYPNLPLIKHSEDILINYQLNDKAISFTQGKTDGWVLIDGADLTDWDIHFIGANASQISEYEQLESRLNVNGLTGCLTFFNSKFSNSNLNVVDTACEDAVNIVSSSGNLNLISIKNTKFDALDLDFSRIAIKKAEISNAGNDCMDFSFGQYLVNKPSISNCGDKGLSIGEKSYVEAQDVNIHQTATGISVKDSSFANINNVKMSQSKICIEARVKKQEFGPAKIITQNLQCEGLINIEPSSILKEVDK